MKFRLARGPLGYYLLPERSLWSESITTYWYWGTSH